MAESNDYQLFKKHVIGPMDRCDRIENIIMTGMPDVNVCIEGTESWIENKSPTEPKRSTTRLFGSNHNISQDQKNWHLRQRNAGGRSYFYIATDKRLMLISGKWADKINDLTVWELEEITLWSALKPVKEKEKWKSLRTILARR